ncbi:MAG: ABC transporter permease, partial [Chloroflexi bacterium]|nr:ABC transporter permease [Chloroflexota bacterium]
RQVRASEGFGIITWEPQVDGANDPLLFFTPTIFLFASAVLLSQLFPLFMHLLDYVGERLAPTPVYMGWKNVARQSGLYTIPLFLVIVCLSLGAFDASLAVSADRWLEERLRYSVGADVAFELGTIPGPDGQLLGVDSWLNPPETYEHLPGVLDATRVGEYRGWTTGAGSQRRVQILGVDRLDLPQVAYFRPDFAPVPLGALLNLLAADPKAMLVTPAFLEKSLLSVGEQVTLAVDVGEDVQDIPFVIVGTFRHFPTVYEREDTAVMVNLDYIFDQCGGAQPHSIWLHTGPDFEQETLRMALDEMGVAALRMRNSGALVAEDTHRPERISIYGNLSVGFLAGSILACLGILIYTFASLVGRLQRFTVLRAIGLRLTQLWVTVSVEYLSVVSYGILVGAAVGVVASRLFVPYFRLTGSLESNVPPFIPEIAWSSVGWMVVVYFLVLSLAELVVLLRVTRRGAFQALRLGDQE